MENYESQWPYKQFPEELTKLGLGSEHAEGYPVEN